MSSSGEREAQDKQTHKGKLPETRKETDSGTSTDTSASAAQVKKPPGFESAEPPSSTANSNLINDWPDLSALVLSEQPQMATSSTLIPPPPASSTANCNSLQPMSTNFPPLSNVTAPAAYSQPQISNNFPSNFHLVQSPNSFPSNFHVAQRGPLIHNTNCSVYNGPTSVSGMPPGFVTSKWQQIQQDPIYSQSSLNIVHPATITTTNTAPPPLSGKTREEYVIETIREALNHNREKFKYFRNLSGWYRNNEITVHEYVKSCRQLFGDSTWRNVGPELAQVMPIESKRNELVQNLFPPSPPPTAYSNHYPVPSAFHRPPSMNWMQNSQPRTVHPDLIQHQQQPRWAEGRHSVPNWQSESEYPSLLSGRNNGATSRMGKQASSMSSASWAARVPV